MPPPTLDLFNPCSGLDPYQTETWPCGCVKSVCVKFRTSRAVRSFNYNAGTGTWFDELLNASTAPSMTNMDDLLAIAQAVDWSTVNWGDAVLFRQHADGSVSPPVTIPAGGPALAAVPSSGADVSRQSSTDYTLIVSISQALHKGKYILVGYNLNYYSPAYTAVGCEDFAASPPAPVDIAMPDYSSVFIPHSDGTLPTAPGDVKQQINKFTSECDCEGYAIHTPAP